ncbi:response regulator [Candidatus Eisenbacteria bacterium]|uniref:Response regulator n=1 Tax=Eiseniibacteriota bacterium TaxID=2212470 RepID=A0ABV6YIP9_UNCEI
MPLKLMTVDDSRTIRRIVSTYAHELDPDVEIIEAANGQECLDKCRETVPDLIVLDINMPVMTGEECLKCLREREETESIPVVLLTTESEKQMVVRLLQLGVQQFIIKPFKQQEFLEKVGAVVKRLDLGSPSNDEDTGSTPTPEGDYILIMEDKENIVRTLTGVAEGQYEVVSTKSPAEAVRHFIKKPPVVVFANLAMAGVDVFGLLQQIWHAPGGESARYVGMCLKTATDVITRARTSGKIELLLKPFAADGVSVHLAPPSTASVETQVEDDICVITPVNGSFDTVCPMIVEAVEAAADDGFMKILVDLTGLPAAELADIALWGTIAERTEGLGLNATYLSPNKEVAAKLKDVLDTKDLVVLTNRGEALQALAA